MNRIVDFHLGDKANYREDAKPSKTPCCSHTLNNGGKRTLSAKGAAKKAHNFRKKANPMFIHPGEARKNASIELHDGKPVVVAGGVRFFVEFEQLAQLDTAGLLNVVNFAKKCARLGHSEASSKSLVDAFDPGKCLLQLLLWCLTTSLK